MIMVIALTAAAVTAAPSETMQRVLVPYGDLDLSRSASARSLTRRVARVAEQICGSGHAKDYPLMYDLQGCRQDVVDRARPQVKASVARARSSTGSLTSQGASISTAAP